MLRRSVGDRQDGYDCFVGLIGGGENEGARAILLSVFLALLVLGKPEVGVSDDQTGLRDRERHRLL
jgi:hypothetical protein